MAHLIPDTIDWSTYERSTEPAVKVHAASRFASDLLEEFAPRDDGPKAEMFSTKLRGRIEFRPGEVTVWAGYNGHRKSMFAGQVALDMCAQQERTLIASMEMYPRKTLARMARQAFAVSVPRPEQLSAFAKWTDGRLWLFDHVGRVEPPIMLAVLRYFAAELNGKQAFIDSMMMVCASEESLDEQKQFMTDMVRVTQETGLHVHLVAHCRKPQSGEDKPPSKYDLRGSAAISDQAHNIVTVYANKAKVAALEKDCNDQKALNEPDQFITVEKQRNGEWEGRAGMWFQHTGLRFCDDRTSAVKPYTLSQPVTRARAFAEAA